MRILFLTCPSYRYQKDEFNVFLQPLPGAYLLPELLRDNGCCVEVVLDLDLIISNKSSYSNLLTKAQSFDLLCLSATSFNWPYLKQFTDDLSLMSKKRPPVIVGGVHATLAPEHLLTSKGVDVVVVGEGETIILELLEVYRRKRPLDRVKGIFFRRGEKIIANPDRPLLKETELKQIPIIKWHDFVGTPKYLSVQTSRGCRMNCAFCSIPFRKSWRPMTLNHILASVEASLKKLPEKGYKSILFGDDCFTTDKTFAINVLKSMQATFPEVYLTLEARIPHLLDDELLDVMADTSIQSIQVGVECGYNEGLKKIGKGITIETVKSFAQKAACKGLGPKIRYSYIIGFPWENLSKIKSTIDFAYSLCVQYQGIIQLNWWLVVPGNSLFVYMKKNYGLNETIFDKPNWSMDKDMFFYTHPWITPDDVNDVRDYCSFLAMSYPNIPMLGSAYNGPWISKQNENVSLIEHLRDYFGMITGKQFSIGNGYE